MSTQSFGMGKKTLKSYIIGLFLSLCFTSISFGIVMDHRLSNLLLFSVICISAILQLISQVIFFLRMNATDQGKWNLMPFLFTMVIIAVLVGGSSWIMYNLDYNMIH